MEMLKARTAYGKEASSAAGTRCEEEPRVASR